MLSKIKGLNLLGVTRFFEVISETPEFLLPHMEVKDIRTIPFESLKAQGFKGVVFDKDNTLSKPYENEIISPLQESFQHCRDVFGNDIAIFSNSAGSSEDINYTMAEVIEENMGVAVIRHEEKKPGGMEDVIAHFGGCDASELVVVGDRYSTDVVFGNMHGMLTIRTEMLTKEGESMLALTLRAVESFAVDRLRKKGVQPRAHPSFSNSRGSSQGQGEGGSLERD